MTCLVAEAVRADRIAELHTVVLDLLERVRESLPLPDASQQVTAPPAADPSTPWFAQTGDGRHPPTLPTEGAQQDRRTRAA